MFTAKHDGSWQNCDVGKSKLHSFMARMCLKPCVSSLNNYLPEIPPVRLWEESSSRARNKLNPVSRVYCVELRLQMK